MDVDKGEERGVASKQPIHATKKSEKAQSKSLRVDHQIKNLEARKMFEADKSTARKSRSLHFFESLKEDKVSNKETTSERKRFVPRLLSSNHQAKARPSIGDQPANHVVRPSTLNTKILVALTP